MKKTNSYRARKGKEYTIVYEIEDGKLCASNIVIGKKKSYKILTKNDFELSHLRFGSIKSKHVNLFTSQNKRIKCCVIEKYPSALHNTKLDQIMFLTTDTGADINEPPKPAGGN